MNKHTKELARFSESGKTFFFNEGEAKNGAKYLAINAIYGQGNQQRVVLFPPHYFQFHRHLTESIQKLTGFSGPGQEGLEPAVLELPTHCPDCSAQSAEWRIVVLAPTDWKIVCGNCDEVVSTSANG
jgi:hypothetical protein